jgi:16S rRNA G966 N2-methylase RsmD
MSTPSLPSFNSLREMTTQRQTFPYKREFIDPEELWKNAVTQKTAQVKLIQPPENFRGWRTLPRGVEWQFQGQPVGCVVSSTAYDTVNKLVDYFSEIARMKAKRKGKPSPIEFYETQYDTVFRKAQNLAASDTSGLPFRHWLREAVYTMVPECTTFKISVTKAIFEFFGSKVVLDPSGGWGDRLLGAAAAGVPVYHAVEPNPNLVQPYKEMIEFVKAHNPNLQYAVIHENFLNVQINPETYDTVFTSPPFFDYEEYVEDPKQSIYGRPTLQNWIQNFFHPYLRKAWNALASGGYFILYISDTRDKYTWNMYNFISNQLQGQFLGVIAVTPETQTHAYPLWVWRK